MKINILLSLVAASVNPFVQPATSTLAKVVQDVCRTIYDNNTVLGRHIQGVFAKLGISIPPLADVSAQLLGLEQALKLFPGLFSTQEEFSTFLANVLWESLCLSQTIEICAGGSGCAEPIYYGRGYIQLTGQANYQAYADLIKRQDVMTNPSLIAQDQAMAWGSALYFWKSIGKCQGRNDAGRALLCINSKECTSTREQSSSYFQFAPYYRLVITQSIANNLGASDMTNDAQNACQQMNFAFNQVWSDFCSFHGNQASVVCPFNPSQSNGHVGSSNGTGPIISSTRSSASSFYRLSDLGLFIIGVAAAVL